MGACSHFVKKKKVIGQQRTRQSSSLKRGATRKKKNREKQGKDEEQEGKEGLGKKREKTLCRRVRRSRNKLKKERGELE